MQIESHGPFRTETILWQPSHGTHALTVICKATFMLTPGTMEVAVQEDPIHSIDDHWDDDVHRSVRAPSDMVPMKPSADIVVVGYAHAPEARPVRSLVARLAVGDIDKRIDVFGERYWTETGELREGAPFARMPLRYEKAAFGPDNPVGVKPVRSAEGCIALPNLQRPGTVVRSATAAFEPIGFGPIAADWPARSTLLGATHPVWHPELYATVARPVKLDLSYFNVAPHDQRLGVLRPDQLIVLEHLHRDNPHLVTRLPGVWPCATLETSGGASETKSLRADTLWVDTDAAIATLTFRGHFNVAHARDARRVRVDVERMPATNVLVPDANGREEATDRTTTTFQAHHGPALPFAQVIGPAKPPLMPLLQLPADVLAAAPRTLGEVMTQPKEEAAPATGKARAIKGSSRSVVKRSASAGAEEACADKPTSTPLVTRPGTAVELLWFDPARLDAIRGERAFRSIMESIKPKSGDADFTESAPPEQRKAAKDRREVTGLLSRGEPLSQDELRRAVDGAVDEDGRFVAPLVLLAGGMVFPFDKLETLKAMLAVVAPFAVTDKVLKEAVDTFAQLAKAPGLQGGVAEGLTRQLEEAFGEVRRGLRAGYLDEQVTQVLLEQRHYQKRTVLGEARIRALVVIPGAQQQVIPSYLPVSLANELPMFQRLAVRLVAEAKRQVDQYETSPIGLRVVALGQTFSAMGRL